MFFLKQNFKLNSIIDINQKIKPETSAYIKGVFNEFIYKKEKDLSKDSITLKYIEAKNNLSFKDFQNIGDWILFSKIILPQSIISEEYYDTIARCSYYKCYLILNKQWILFEELADKFPELKESIKINY